MPVLQAAKLSDTQPDDQIKQRCREQGAFAQLVQERLGHSSVTISKRYLHESPSDDFSLHLPF